MKKVMIALLLSVLLAGCNQDTGEPFNSDLVDIGDLGEGYDLVRDANTGCIYTMETFSLSLSPYYDENGNVAGCGEEDLNKSKYE